MTLDEDVMYLISSNFEVKWYDVSDPVSPTFIDSLVTGSIQEVSISDGKAYGRETSGYFVLELCATPPDTDGDGVPDDEDNCPAVANSGQEDSDEDGFGDVCDICPNDPDNDIDADGICGDDDNCPDIANASQLDTDGDGFGNACDEDDDNDGLSDVDEIAGAGMGCTDPLVADSDGDGIPDGAEVMLGLNPCNADSDNDGLADGLEEGHDTDPLNADSDGDGLLDGTEVDMQAFSGVPDCSDPAFGGDDSDGDTLSDGDEVFMYGTDPCSTDTDGDTIADNIDDLPLTPGVSSGFIESDLRALCALVKEFELENFSAPNNNARKGRRNAMCNKLNSAAKKVAQGDFASARDQLQSLLQKVDDENQPPDWMVHVGMDPTGKDVVRDDVELMIFLIELVL